MRKRVPIVIGGGVALIIASQYFNMGLGFQDGDGAGTAEEQAEMASLENAIADIESMTPDAIFPEESDESTDTVPTEMSLVPAAPTMPPVVDVLIDGNQYLVSMDAVDGDQREAKTLDEIIAFAAQVPGEPSGIRVRVARTPDAVASAESAIMSRLTEAGLTKDEIDSRRQLVE